MRLVAAGLAHGSYDTAAEIELAPGAHTYWRDPGEAGVPPVFSFAGSDNVAHAEVLYPVPQRLEEAGFAIFGYTGGVSFPIRVTPRDAKQPVRLDLSLDYAVCDRICIPAKGHAELVLPQSGAGPEAAEIASAQARVPLMLSGTQIADKLAIRPVAGSKAKPGWSLVWKGNARVTDLFAVGPDGWAFETHETAKNAFSLTAVQMPASFNGGSVPVELTFAGQPKAYAANVPLSFKAGER